MSGSGDTAGAVAKRAAAASLAPPDTIDGDSAIWTVGSSSVSSLVVASSLSLLSSASAVASSVFMGWPRLKRGPEHRVVGPLKGCPGTTAFSTDPIGDASLTGYEHLLAMTQPDSVAAALSSVAVTQPSLFADRGSRRRRANSFCCRIVALVAPTTCDTWFGSKVHPVVVCLLPPAAAPTVSKSNVMYASWHSFLKASWSGPVGCTMITHGPMCFSGFITASVAFAPGSLPPLVPLVPFRFPVCFAGNGIGGLDLSGLARAASAAWVLISK